MRKIQRKLRNGQAHIKKLLSKTRSNVKDKVNDLQHQFIAYVKKNPLKTVGISLLAGAIISHIRRFRK